MAAAFLRDELNCSICLSTYLYPVTLRCGHSFCQICIDRLLDSQEELGVYSCPECRAEYQKRPVLNRNVTLTSIAERFLAIHPRQVDSDTDCTYCMKQTSPAAKTCLLCEASLCDNHLWVHKKAPEHVLTEPTASPEKRKCSIHKKVLEFRCTEDNAYICASCRLVGDHWGHQVETLHETAEKVKDKLRNVLDTLTLLRDQTDRRIGSLKKDKRKVEEEVLDVTIQAESLVAVLKVYFKDLKKRVLEEISRQAQTIFFSASKLIQQLETRKKEIDDKILHINEICHMTDPVTVLQEQEANKMDLSDGEAKDNENKLKDGETFYSIGAINGKLISETLGMVCDFMAGIHSRNVFLQPADILLDADTAASKICVSSDFKTISFTYEKQNYSDTPLRFQHYPQIVSLQSFSSGRHYWEVEVSRDGIWRVGMAYASIARKGDQSVIGYNHKSWCLCGHGSEDYVLRHDQNIIKPAHETSCRKFRIYLDYEAGQLSFYELGNGIKHLHTFTTTFTEPLHAAFFAAASWIKLI